MLEIGPGSGALTEHLLPRAAMLVVVEKDCHWASFWQARAHERLLAVHGDALDLVEDLVIRHALDWVVGNLPYHISGPLMAKIAGLALAGVVVMVQQEVAERIAAPPGSRAFSRLSALVRHHYHPEITLRLGPGAFFPPPKVHSAVVRLRATPPLPVPFAHYAETVRIGFAHPRKTLRNNLRGWLTAEAIAALGLDPGMRPQAVPPEGWAEIAQARLKSSGSSSPRRSSA